MAACCKVAGIKPKAKYSKAHREGMPSLRVNEYPPLPKIAEKLEADLIERNKYGTVTYYSTVLKNGRWYGYMDYGRPIRYYAPTRNEAVIGVYYDAFCKKGAQMRPHTKEKGGKST